MAKFCPDTSIAFSYNVTEEKLIEFIEYRRSIGKPIKTQRGIKQNLEQALKCSMELTVSADKAFDITMDEEWQGVKVEYIRNHLRATGKINHEEHQRGYGKPATAAGKQSIASRIRQNQGTGRAY